MPRLWEWAFSMESGITATEEQRAAELLEAQTKAEALFHEVELAG
jgi:hypothetical protein